MKSTILQCCFFSTYMIHFICKISLDLNQINCLIKVIFHQNYFFYLINIKICFLFKNENYKRNQTLNNKVYDCVQNYFQRNGTITTVTPGLPNKSPACRFKGHLPVLLNNWVRSAEIKVGNKLTLVHQKKRDFILYILDKIYAISILCVFNVAFGTKLCCDYSSAKEP